MHYKGFNRKVLETEIQQYRKQGFVAVYVQRDQDGDICGVFPHSVVTAGTIALVGSTQAIVDQILHPARAE